jgi:protein-L-isoaspartate(D-aspartate) O-methyltransferase
VEPAGHVAAIEFDASLAARAGAALAPWPNVTVTNSDGADFPHADVDRIYVNFGVARPADAWLDHLAPGGVLVFPLVAPPAKEPDALHGDGAVLAVAATPTGFAASFVSRCSFVRAHGVLAGDMSLQKRLHDAFGNGGVDFVGSLRRRPSSPDRCWLWTPEWSLSYDPPAP